ncbi:MAG: beta-hydroxyacyl-ACP dehydratase [Hungatella sp.]|nr:beta-hydroxyacyl-ACP dehydratase [Hungatella sp.]
MQDLDINQIMEYHNCRYPVLMIDYVTEVLPGKYAKGYKNFTYNEWFFPAHFEDDPNVPSSIMLEALSQMMLMTFLTKPEYKKKHTACLRINNVEFKRKIIPGERMDIQAALKTARGGIFTGYAEGTVKGETAVKADYVIGIPDIITSSVPKKKD